MDHSVAENFLQSRTALVILSALVAVMFSTANLPWQLDDYDQAKAAYDSAFEVYRKVLAETTAP